MLISLVSNLYIVKMLCKVSFCLSGLKKAVVAEDLSRVILNFRRLYYLNMSCN